MYYHDIGLVIWNCSKCPRSKVYPILDSKIDALNKSIMFLILELYFYFYEES
jgi:hypothetical protein